MVRVPTHQPPTHPGEMLLEEFLVPLGISQNEFARRIGVSFARLNEIVRGTRGVTVDTAIRRERALVCRRSSGWACSSIGISGTRSTPRSRRTSSASEC